jgi:hypothetical protein
MSSIMAILGAVFQSDKYAVGNPIVSPPKPLVLLEGSPLHTTSRLKTIGAIGDMPNLTDLKEETTIKDHRRMMNSCLLGLNLFSALLHFVILNLHSRNALAAENLFLRKQLAFYQERGIKPGRSSQSTRLTLMWLSRWFNWRGALTVVTPRTFIGWHGQGFQFYWRRKCQAGRPRIPLELQQLIRRMARENASWFTLV